MKKRGNFRNKNRKIIIFVFFFALIAISSCIIILEITIRLADIGRHIDF